MLEDMNAFAEQLGTSGRYDTTDNFTVVVQPFMKLYTPKMLVKGKINNRIY
jgi:hypothetical protein